MLSPDQHHKIAESLHIAEKTAIPIEQIDIQYPDIDIADAYAIQKILMERKILAGDSLRGHKIGLTSRAMQSSVGIDEPDYGHLLASMFFSDGAQISMSKLIVPRVELELAFVLSKPLHGPNVNIFDVINATDFVVPAIELIDGRSKYPRRIVDNIADNAACAGIVTGGRPVRPDSIDLRWVSALLFKNGCIEESGVSAAVLGHPALGIAWLANKLSLHGDHLKVGQVVLSGSFTRMVAVKSGDVIHADFGPLGSISVSFE